MKRRHRLLGIAASAVLLSGSLGISAAAAPSDLMPDHFVMVDASSGGYVNRNNNAFVFMAGGEDANFVYSVDTQVNINDEIYCYYDVTATGEWDIQWNSLAQRGCMHTGLSADFGNYFGKVGEAGPDQYGTLLKAGHYDHTITELRVDGAWKWNDNVPDDGIVTITTVEIKVAAGSTLTLNKLYFANKEEGDAEEAVYQYGDYLYKYNFYWRNGWVKHEEQNGWGVRVADPSKSSYGPILSEIEGKPVVSVAETFRDCKALTQAPVIPSSVTDMTATFWGCISLKQAPLIPAEVENMDFTFADCSSLTAAPIIPEGVTAMESTFTRCASLKKATNIPGGVLLPMNTYADCTSLKEGPVIGEGVKYLSMTFRGCTSLEKAPEIPSTVTTMDMTFAWCSSLTEAPKIPDSVTDMEGTFENAIRLTGEIMIPQDVTHMLSCFEGTEKPITMKYYADCAAAADYQAPGNVTKVVIGGEEPEPVDSDTTAAPVSSDSSTAPTVSDPSQTASLAASDSVASPATGENAAVTVTAMVFMAVSAGILIIRKKK